MATKPDPTGVRPLPNQRPGSNPRLRVTPGGGAGGVPQVGGRFLNPLNLGGLATAPMQIGQPGVPLATPAPARQATPEGGPTRAPSAPFQGTGTGTYTPPPFGLPNTPGGIYTPFTGTGTSAQPLPVGGGPLLTQPATPYIGHPQMPNGMGVPSPPRTGSLNSMFGTNTRSGPIEIPGGPLGGNGAVTGSGLGGLMRAIGGGAAGAGAVMANPVGTAKAAGGSLGLLREPTRPRTVAQPVGQQRSNNGPQNMPGTFRAANNPNNYAGGGGGIGMNIPNPAATASMMIGAQNNAMGNAVAAGNRARVGGGLTSVTGPSGALQNPGLYTAAYNAAPKAQQTIGAMGDVGDARWNSMMGPGDTYTDQGQIIRSGAGGGAGAGGSTGTGASGSSGAGAGGTSPPNGAQQLLDPLVAQFQQAMDDANAANDQRYDQGLGMLQANQARGQADLARMGQSRAQEIRDDARRASAQGMQNLTARGLANTTNLPTMQRGVARDANRAQTALGDAMAQNRFNQNRATTNDITNWIYNRDDQAPSFDTLAQLALGLAQSQVQPPAFDINDVMSRLGNTPSIQDLLSMLPQLQAGNLQQPYMQYPNLPNINFPQQGQQGQQQQGAAGNVGQQGRPGMQGGGQQQGGSLGGTGLALGGYGMAQAMPYLSQGMNQFIQNPGSTIANSGNNLGSLIGQGASAISNGLQSLFGGGGGGYGSLYNGVPLMSADPFAQQQQSPSLASLFGSFFG